MRPIATPAPDQDRAVAVEVVMEADTAVEAVVVMAVEMEVAATMTTMM